MPVAVALLLTVVLTIAILARAHVGLVAVRIFDAGLVVCVDGHEQRCGGQANQSYNPFFGLDS